MAIECRDLQLQGSGDVFLDRGPLQTTWAFHGGDRGVALAANCSASGDRWPARPPAHRATQWRPMPNIQDLSRLFPRKCSQVPASRARRKIKQHITGRYTAGTLPVFFLAGETCQMRMLLQLRRSHKRWLLDPALGETPLVRPAASFRDVPTSRHSNSAKSPRGLPRSRFGRIMAFQLTPRWPVFKGASGVAVKPTQVRQDRPTKFVSCQEDPSACMTTIAIQNTPNTLLKVMWRFRISREAIVPLVCTSHDSGCF
jgi:hypothetical protein